FGVTFLAFAVTYLAWRNGKITRENTLRIVEEIKNVALKTDKGFERMDMRFEKMHEEMKGLVERVIRVLR
ncbi:MAG: hypothetical protein ABDH49_03960, partial [Candidatus Hydrothermales bacterium]